MSDITGAVAGFAAGAATANPAIAIGVGIGVRAATREGLRYVARERRQNEHDAITAAVSALSVGETHPWSFEPRIGRAANGMLRVLRVIETPLTVCKEIAFSIADIERGEAASTWFTSVACRHDDGWRWAAAEPAVDRWGNLQ